MSNLHISALPACLGRVKEAARRDGDEWMAAFKEQMVAYLVGEQYPAGILMEAVDQAIRHPFGSKEQPRMPAVNEMIELCDALIAPLRNELSELRRQQEMREERQRLFTDFQNRLAGAIGEVAPSLDDIELAARLVPHFRRARITNMPSWPDFADEDPQACAELAKRLAAIARAEFPDSHSREIEIQQLLVDAARERERKHWLGVEQ